jgi:hypothetical protein
VPLERYGTGNKAAQLESQAKNWFVAEVLAWGRGLKVEISGVGKEIWREEKSWKDGGDAVPGDGEERGLENGLTESTQL